MMLSRIGEIGLRKIHSMSLIENNRGRDTGH